MRKPKAYCVYWKNISNGTYGQIYTLAWSKEVAFMNAMRYLNSTMWHDVWIAEVKHCV